MYLKVHAVLQVHVLQSNKFSTRSTVYVSGVLNLVLRYCSTSTALHVNLDLYAEYTRKSGTELLETTLEAR